MRDRREELKKIIVAGVDASGRLPKVADLAAELNLRIYPTQRMLKALADEGFLRKTKNNWYEINNGKKPPESTPLTRFMKALSDEGFPTTRESNPPKDEASFSPEMQTRTALLIIKWSMLVVGIGSVIISAYYNVLLALDFLPAILAVIAGCIFVLFSVVDFETILLFSTFKSMNPWKRRGTMAGLAAVWIVAATFSITSVVNGRYEKYMRMQQDKSSTHMEINAERLKWLNIQERKKTVAARIEERRGQLTKAEIINDKKLERFNATLEQLRAAEVVMIKNTPEATDANLTSGEYTDFYAWLSEVFGLPKEKIHFFISMLPAFFFDVISPIAIALFLFLKRK